jgi:hypothetical protein
VLKAKKAVQQLGALSILAPDVASKERGSEMSKTRSISPARIASASLVSLEKNVNEMCWISTFPPHQSGLADSCAPPGRVQAVHLPWSRPHSEHPRVPKGAFVLLGELHLEDAGGGGDSRDFRPALIGTG